MIVQQNESSNNQNILDDTDTINHVKLDVQKTGAQGKSKKEKQEILLDRLHILMHNTQGLNDALKYRNWIEKCYENNFHIIGMTETKIAESSNHKLYLANPYYNVYTANSNKETANKQESSMGVGIAVIKTLQPYIHNIMTVTGIAIAVDFLFPSNQKIRIVSIYLQVQKKYSIKTHKKKY